MIQDTINLIVNRYRKLGYKVKNIKWRLVESFAYSELAPLSSEKTNDIINIDDAAFVDLKNNKAAQMFYLAHEIAHCATDANHGDKRFEEAIKKYNETYSEKTVADPGDEYNKKYLPTFYKKDVFLDTAKTEEQAKTKFRKEFLERRNNGLLKESCFNY